MRIVAMLASEGNARLRAALPSSWTVRSARDLSDVVGVLETRERVAVVIDPTTISLRALTDLANTCARFGTRFLVYTALGIESAQCIVALPGKTDFDVVFHDAEGETAHLTSRLLALNEPSVQTLVLQGLRQAVLELPPELGREVVGLFGGIRVPSSPQELFARVAPGHRRRWERALSRAGLCNASLLLAAARLTRSWDLLRTAESVSRVAELSGFASTRSFNKHFRAAFNTSPRHGRGDLTTEEFARRIVQHVNERSRT
jgi:AraC-like DNA-binding protein